MNNEMKRLLSAFLFVNVLISCIGIILVGSTVVRERGEKNIYDKAYTVMKVITDEKSINVNLGEKKYSLSLMFSKKLKEYEEYIYFTPFAPMYYLGKSISQLGFIR